MRLPSFCLGRELTFMLLYGLIAASSLIGTGTTLGYSAVALPVLVGNSTTVTLDSHEVPLFASLPTVAQVFGSLASLATMKQGRRFAIGTGSTVSALGWVVISFSYNVYTLFLGRVITGFAAGLCASAGAVYIGEISRAQWRAACTSCTSIFISLGVVMVYFFGFLMQDSWSGVAGACVLVPAISSMSTILFLPESPTWLLTKDRQQEAKTSLCRIRGHSSENARFQEEFDELTKYVEARRNVLAAERFEGSSYVAGLWWRMKQMLKAFTLPEVWKPFFVLNSYFLFQQFSGTYVMMSYAVNILLDVGLTDNPFFVTVMLGLIQVFAGILSAFCGIRLGRRTITLTSSVGMAIALFVLAMNILFRSLDMVPLSVYRPLSFVSVIVFSAAASFGLIMLPWAMVAELYPARYVNFLGPLTTSLGALYHFVAIQVYPGFVEKHGILVAIWFFYLVSMVATIFMAFLLPETRCKSRTEIEEGFKKWPAIRRK